MPDPSSSAAVLDPGGILSLDAPVSGRIQAAVEHLLSLLDQRAGLSAEEKLVARKAQDIQRIVLPDLMAELGSTRWERDNMAASVVNRVTGTLARAPDLDAAIAILRDGGFDGAIESTLSISFGEADADLVEAAAEIIAETLGREVRITRGVNPQTLAAWARARMAQGMHVDLAALGLATWREVTVSRKGNA